MKKIAELLGDEFLDVIYALTPILPMIVDMEITQMQLFGKYNENIVNARKVVANEKEKLNKTLEIKEGDGTTAFKSKTIENCNKKIAEATNIIENEISLIFGRDISKIIPLLASKDNRNCIFETLSILDNLPVAQVKKYPSPKLCSKIKSVIGDTDFKSFLSYAEQSE